jgi:hypothetical protein
MATPSLHTSTRTSSSRRAGRSLWVLVGVGVLASGSLSAALSADTGPITGTRVAASGLMLVASVVLAARVMFAIERARRRGHTEAGKGGPGGWA